MPKHDPARLREGPSRSEQEVLYHKQFYTVVGECAGKIHDALNVLTAEQERLQKTVAKFAGTSDRALDDYCVYLFGLSGESARLLREKWLEFKPLFKSIKSMCHRHVEDVADIAETLRKRDVAFAERRHYEEKVYSLSPGARLDRNKEKLNEATEALTFAHVVSQQKVDIALKQHPKVVRLTAVRLSEAVMRILQQFGGATSSYDPGLKVGSEVQMIGGGGQHHPVTGLGPCTARINEEIVPSALLTPVTWQLPESEEPAAESSANETSDAGTERQTVEEILEHQRETLSIDDKKEPQKTFTIAPRRICRGKETQFSIMCPTLGGPIAEVLIDGQRMEVVSGMRDHAVVSGVLEHVTQGKIEVMTQEARSMFASGEVDLVLYDLDRFLRSPAGTNIEFNSDMTAAKRVDGSVNGICLLSLTKPYFEVEIDEVIRKGATRAASFGFTAAKFTNARLPNIAGELKKGLVVGGDLPQMYMDSEKQAVKIPWRPLNELSEGDRIQVVLAHNTFKIFQNGTEKVSVHLPSAHWLYEPLVGIIDIAGSLRGVTIVDDVEPLAHPLFGEEAAASVSDVDNANESASEK